MLFKAKRDTNKTNQRYKMEQVVLQYICIVLHICWTAGASVTSKSKLVQTRTALEDILRTEFYSMHDNYERDIFIRRFNETLEYLGNLAGEFEAHTLANKYNATKYCDLESVLNIFQQNSETTSQLKESLQRTVIGISQDKKTRFENTNAITARIDKFEDQQTDILSMITKLHESVVEVVVKTAILENTSQDQVDKVDVMEKEIERYELERAFTRT